MIRVSEIRAEYRNRLAEAVREEFPIGSSVAWRNGKHIQAGVVVNYGLFGETVFVENARSNKIIPIDSGRLSRT